MNSPFFVSAIGVVPFFKVGFPADLVPGLPRSSGFCLNWPIPDGCNDTYRDRKHWPDVSRLQARFAGVFQRGHGFDDFIPEGLLPLRRPVSWPSLLFPCGQGTHHLCIQPGIGIA
ncbi:hypothetical protein [Comamonas sp. MYb396]|uniref:hypothetical protein n=1 Tax=Comamonas sp. MYb396 TaxID=2745302 RepID=UPI0030ADCC2E